ARDGGEPAAGGRADERMDLLGRVGLDVDVAGGGRVGAGDVRGGRSAIDADPDRPGGTDIDRGGEGAHVEVDHERAAGHDGERGAGGDGGVVDVGGGRGLRAHAGGGTGDAGEEADADADGDRGDLLMAEGADLDAARGEHGLAVRGLGGGRVGDLGRRGVVQQVDIEREAGGKDPEAQGAAAA